MKPYFINSSLKSVAFGVPVILSTYFFYTMFKCSQRRRTALEGKVVVITGASSGIGEALAHEFYEQGSIVVLAARRQSELNRVKAELLAKKVDLITHEPFVVPLDLAAVDEIEDFVKKVYDLCGGIDILINNGGVSHRASVLDTKFDVDTKIMYINYFGAVALTKAVLPKMVERKSGHIVFVSSVQGLIAIPDRSAYAASKHAMQAFADSLRSEVHCHNINVTVISPGYVKTNVSLNALAGDGSHHGVMDKSTAAGFAPEYCAKKILDAVVSVLPKMVERKSGHIVFVSSVQGLIAIPDRSAYAASKHAMQAFADSLRSEVHCHNINVTVISPGYVKTNVSLNALAGDGSHHGVMDKSTAAGFAPEYCAKKILDAVVCKKKELIISQFLPNLAIFLRHFAPSLYFWVMVRRANQKSW